MKIIRCDKCGKEMDIVTLNTQTTVLPTYDIVRKIPGLNHTTASVDLCPECEKKFDIWLKTKEE